MGIEGFNVSELPIEQSDDVKKEKKEKREKKEKKEVDGGSRDKIISILTDLRSAERSPQDKKIMKQLLLRTQEAGELLGKQTGKKMKKLLSGRDPKTGAFDRHNKRWYTAAQRSIKKESSEMNDGDKVNVLFAAFGNGLLARLGEEKVDMKNISDGDFDRVYKNIVDKMSGVIVDKKLDDLGKRIFPGIKRGNSTDEGPSTE